VNNVDDEIYIGSTCLPFPKRLYWHKLHAKRNIERKVYKHLNAIGWENVKIILIETFPCESKAELEKRERFWFDELKPTLNSNFPSRSIKEYQQSEAYKISKRKSIVKCQNTPVYKAKLEKERAAKKQATAHKKLLMCKINGFLAYHRILSDNFKNEY